MSFTSGIFLFEGVEHLVGGDEAFNLVLVRLSDSRVRTIVRPAECNQAMLYFDHGPFRVFCRTPQGHSVFPDLVAQGDTLTPSGAASVVLAPGEDVHSIGFPSADRELIASSQTMRLLAPLTGESSDLALLDGRTLLGTLAPDVIVATTIEGEGQAYWTVRAEPGARWQRLGAAAEPEPRIDPLGGRRLVRRARLARRDARRLSIRGWHGTPRRHRAARRRAAGE
jgi:hypothetical protein